MKLPHMPNPLAAASGAAHQFAHVASRVAKHIDNAEHASNLKMHNHLSEVKHGHKDPLRGPLGTAIDGAKHAAQKLPRRH